MYKIPSYTYNRIGIILCDLIESQHKKKSTNKELCVYKFNKQIRELRVQPNDILHVCRCFINVGAINFII